MKKGEFILRWTLFIPAAIAAYLLASLLGSYAIHFLDWSDIWLGVILKKILPYALAAIGGYFFIIAGTKVAPSHNRQVAYVLLSILTVYSAFIIYLSGRVETWDIAIASFVRIIFAVIAVFIIKRSIAEQKSDSYSEPKL